MTPGPGSSPWAWVIFGLLCLLTYFVVGVLVSIPVMRSETKSNDGQVVSHADGILIIVIWPIVVLFVAFDLASKLFSGSLKSFFTYAWTPKSVRKQKVKIT